MITCSACGYAHHEIEQVKECYAKHEPKPTPPEVPACRERVMDGGGDCMPCANPLPCAEHPPEVPFPCTLYCPFCWTLHVDEGEWATRPHHKHLCQNPKCGKLWRVEPYCYGVDPGPKDDMQYDYGHAQKEVPAPDHVTVYVTKDGDATNLCGDTHPRGVRYVRAREGGR